MGTKGTDEPPKYIYFPKTWNLYLSVLSVPSVPCLPFSAWPGKTAVLFSIHVRRSEGYKEVARTETFCIRKLFSELTGSFTVGTGRRFETTEMLVKQGNPFPVAGKCFPVHFCFKVPGNTFHCCREICIHKVLNYLCSREKYFPVTGKWFPGNSLVGGITSLWWSSLSVRLRI
jgi:hypothetical protein